MIRSILLAAIPLITLSCDREDVSIRKKEIAQSSSFPNESRFYGEYYFSLKDISLELTAPNKFQLATYEFGGECLITTKSFAFGRFNVKGDFIVLLDSLTQNEFVFERKN